MMTIELNPNIDIVTDERKKHSKASEEYIHVRFSYPQDHKEWNGWVPVEYRRTGVSINTKEELVIHLNKVYDQMAPQKYDEWLRNQELFWKDKEKAKVTKSFFDCLVQGGWQCVECMLPKNPNWARRIQDLKEFGYTIATDISKHCEHCQDRKTHLILLPVDRGAFGGNGYETLSPRLRKKIIETLGRIDVYENVKNQHCLPDHKFSEIRWDKDTKEDNPDDMTREDIRQKFQLLTNQRNQQKREVCRTCYQTGVRGTIFGIRFFYQGTERWDTSIPPKGKDAEKGCEGCPWYDIDRWRKELLKKVNS